MIDYIVISIISCLLFSIGSKLRNKWNYFSLLAIILPSLMAGFRSTSVGSDTITYHTMTYHILDSSLSFSENLINDQEILYYILSLISNYLGGIWFVFFSYQLFTILFIYLTAWHLKKLIPVWCVIWLYYCFLFPYSLNIMRQVAAISFLLYSSLFLLKGSPKKFWLCAVFSISLHASAFIVSFFIWGLYCVSQKRGNKLFTSGIGYISIVLIVYFCFLKIIPLMNLIGFAKLNNYAGDTYTADNGSYISATDLTLRLLIIFIILIALSSNIINKKLSFLYLLLIVTEIMFFALGLYNQFLFRMALYLTSFHLVMLPLIANSPKLTCNTRKICTNMVVIIGITYWWWVFVHNGTNEIVPYSYSW